MVKSQNIGILLKKFLQKKVGKIITESSKETSNYRNKGFTLLLGLFYLEVISFFLFNRAFLKVFGSFVGANLENMQHTFQLRTYFLTSSILHISFYSF